MSLMLGKKTQAAVPLSRAVCRRAQSYSCGFFGINSKKIKGKEGSPVSLRNISVEIVSFPESFFFLKPEFWDLVWRPPSNQSSLLDPNTGPACSPLFFIIHLHFFFSRIRYGCYGSN